MKLYLPRSHRREDTLVDRSPELEPRGRGEHVLLVEDDDRVREVVRRQLLQLGYDVTAVAGIHEALRALQADPNVALLLTDVVLSAEGNGRDLATRARALRAELPVLFMSGYTENTVIHHGRLDPGVLLLEKPFNRETLARRVREAIGSN
jgi:CheY-like chemotaxis protein